MTEWVSKSRSGDWTGVALMSPSGTSDEVRWLERWDRPALPTPEVVEWPTCMGVIESLSKIGEIRWARVLRLDPGSEIPWHVDPLPPTIHRYHHPLSTSADVLFEFDGDEDGPFVIPLGAVVEIDPRIRHRVQNTSDHHRIHLVVDVDIPTTGHPARG